MFNLSPLTIFDGKGFKVLTNKAYLSGFDVSISKLTPSKLIFLPKFKLKSLKRGDPFNKFINSLALALNSKLDLKVSNLNSVLDGDISWIENDFFLCVNIFLRCILT